MKGCGDVGAEKARVCRKGVALGKMEEEVHINKGSRELEQQTDPMWLLSK